MRGPMWCQVRRELFASLLLARLPMTMEPGKRKGLMAVVGGTVLSFSILLGYPRLQVLG
jgi:hypothetical protein